MSLKRASVQRVAGQRNGLRRAVVSLGLAVWAVGAVGASPSQGQAVYTYSTATASNAYLNGSHWLVGGSASTKFPGLSGSTAAANAFTNGSATDVAQIGAVGFSASGGFGINFDYSANNGLSANAGAAPASGQPGALSVGAFEFSSTATKSYSIGNSATAATATGTLTLNGATLDGIGNTVVANEGGQTYTFAPSVVTSGAPPGMVVALGNPAANVIQADGAGGVTISAVVQNGGGGGGGGALAVNSTGTGVVLLSAANSYTGGTSVTTGTLATAATGSLGTGGVTVGTTTAAGGVLTLGNGTSVADTATLSFSDNSTVNLNAASGASEVVAALVDLSQPAVVVAPGTYSAATLDGMFHHAVFSSANAETLTVGTAAPEPNSLVLAAVAALPLAARRAGRRAAGWSRPAA